MRLYRIIYAVMSQQTAVVCIDHGDRCLYVNPDADPFSQEVALVDAVDQLNAHRRRRVGFVARDWVGHPV